MSQSPERVVIITGCSNGSLGAALAERFASQGCNVFATARNVTKMGSLSSGIRSQAGRIDILVNCAGGNHVGALMDFSLEDIEALFKTNLFGTMRVTKAVVQHMVQRKSGLIINLGSVAGNTATPWYGRYSASKAALHSSTETLDMELRPFNIKVLLLALGMVHSTISNSTDLSHPASSLYSAFRKNIEARRGQGDDVMSTEVFARKTVDAALHASPPGYLSFGGQAAGARIVGMIPRGTRLDLLWKMYSAKEPK